MKQAIKIINCLSVIIYATLTAGCQTEHKNEAARKALNKQSLENYTHPDRWKDDIQKFIDADKQNPPPQNAVLFVGSSSIRMWDTKKSFPDISTVNRGFGGSFVIDSLYYADRIILPYKPKTIVFYAGDNDIACNKSPEMVAADFQSLFYKIRQTLPETRIIYISIKPSVSRWNYWPQMAEANKLIANFCKQQQNTYFVDVAKVLLNSEGKPRTDVLKDDGLHLNEKGYELWTSLVRPLIDKK